MNTDKTALIFDIKKFAVHDGPGIRTTVFFKGCPLQCQWCHNPESISFQSELQYMKQKCISCGECVRVCPTHAHEMINGRHQFDRSKCNACGACESACLESALVLCGKEMTVQEVLDRVLQDKEFYEQSGGGVTLSGGECLCQAEFCAELLKRLKQQGIHCAVDTSGYVKRKAIEIVEPYTDMFLYDMKHIDESGHIRCTGHSNKQILENLIYLNEKGKKIEIRIPVIPYYNDMTLEQIATFLKKIGYTQKVMLLPYNNLAGSKYLALGKENTMPQVIPPNESVMKKALEIFKVHEINVIF